MPVSFSDFLLSLQADAAHSAFVGFNPEETRLRFPRVRRAFFHLVLAGEAAVRLHDGGGDEPLKAGDFVLLIRGDGHDIGDPDAAVETLADQSMPLGEEPPDLLFGEPRCRLMSGTFGLEQFRDEATTTAMPPVVITPIGREPAFSGIFSSAGLESFQALAHGPGGRAFVGTMLRLLYVETMRRTLERISGNDPSSLRKLGISQIAAVRRLIHAQPGRAWTLAEMARSVGMSRSVFARRFHQVTGQTPQNYLAGIRFDRASRLIEGGASVAEASAHVGYTSPSAFARAFSRHRGSPPSRMGHGPALTPS